MEKHDAGDDRHGKVPDMALSDVFDALTAVKRDVEDLRVSTASHKVTLAHVQKDLDWLTTEVRRLMNADAEHRGAIREAGRQAAVIGSIIAAVIGGAFALLASMIKH